MDRRRSPNGAFLSALAREANAPRPPKPQPDPERRGRAFLRIFRGGKSTAQIAAMLNISESEAYNVLSKARESERVTTDKRP